MLWKNVLPPSSTLKWKQYIPSKHWYPPTRLRYCVNRTGWLSDNAPNTYLGRETGYSNRGFSWFFSAVLGRYRDSTRRLYSKPFRICHSTIILPLDPIQSHIFTWQNEGCENVWPSPSNLTVAPVKFPLKSQRLSFTVPISSCGFQRNPSFDPLLHITGLVENSERTVSLNMHVMSLKSS